MIGHVYPVWYEFRGGKGAGTLVGVLLVLWPLAVVLMIAVQIIATRRKMPRDAPIPLRDYPQILWRGALPLSLRADISALKKPPSRPSSVKAA